MVERWKGRRKEGGRIIENESRKETKIYYYYIIL